MVYFYDVGKDENEGVKGIWFGISIVDSADLPSKVRNGNGYVLCHSQAIPDPIPE